MSETTSKNFVPPDVQLWDQIEFADSKDAPKHQWVAGHVTRRMNDGMVECRIYDNNYARLKLSVRHVDDPMLDKVGIRKNDSGVYRLSRNQLRLNRLEEVDRRMAALEETFKAVLAAREHSEEAAAAEHPRKSRRPEPVAVGG